MERPAVSADVFRTTPENRYRLTRESRQALRQLSRPSERSGELSPLGYSLTISHAHRFVWFRVAKVASRSILGYFAEHDIELDVHHAQNMRYPTAVFGDYLKFAFVRHPLPRFVSAWQDKVVNNNYFGFDDATLSRMRERVETFAEWTATQDLDDPREGDVHLALQTRLIDLSQVDLLGRLETFDADFAMVCDRLGLPAAPVKPRNTTSAPATYSDELRAAVAEMYRRDFQVLGYDPA
ncbi:sulfotransferase family protein [Nocardioides sp. SR21]|uniref:sulfotransferase family protein n=1 Tax=Nocardioides sp. SR21 TaxID=2919501 RepID=UPI001FA99D9E|nr:sulfotransferase family protein [Nocardioides sp. SR21]